MDPKRFDPNLKTGSIVPISQPEPDFAFVPDQLPPNFQMNENIWRLLIEAKAELFRLDGCARALQNPQLLLSPLRRQESLTSSALEGTFATPEELLLFELEPRDAQDSRDPANAWNEVHNYNKALAQGYFRLNELPFCTRLIKELHGTLMAGVRGGNKNPGEFRRHQVHIESTKRYIPPPVPEMEECISDFDKYVNNPPDSLDPLIRCFVAHYQLEAIHPFSDGNGRIGRVLLSLMIYAWCELKMPWLYMSPYFERYKDEYYKYLFKVSTHGAWDEWIEYCLNGVVKQASFAVRKCEKLRELRDEMLRKVTAGRARAHAIIDLLFESPMVRIIDIKVTHSIAYETAKKELEYLEKLGILRKFQQAKPVTYWAPEIFNIANADDYA